MLKQPRKLSSGDVGPLPRTRRAVAAAPALRFFVDKVTRPMKERNGWAESQIVGLWPRIVGPEWAARSEPLRLSAAPGRRDGATLTVAAVGGVALELQHATTQLIERLNQVLGANAIREIKIVQRPVRPIRSAPALPSRDSPGEPAGIGELADIADGRLRTALLRLLRASRV